MSVCNRLPRMLARPGLVPFLHPRAFGSSYWYPQPMNQNNYSAESKKLSKKGVDTWRPGDDMGRMFDSFLTPWDTPFDWNDYSVSPQGKRSWDWTPKIDVRESDHDICVNAELPGMKKEDIKISVKNGNLLFSGERKYEETKEEGEMRRTERSYGTFVRTMALPDGCDPKNIKAKYEDGILELTIPKPAETKKENVHDISIS
eukprot:TRINITY_DN449_c0_g1_i1.p1 TRINITY_DN449_c0_g1~~TRINITY_DN449_c0_g1_i1.p1  ORF type:complete len:218 (+),score=49.79 TRINITY_DN449_c0_g1_i1:51-656(+)